MILARLKAWALGLLAFAGMVAAAFWLGRHKGKRVAQQAEAVRDAQANAQAAQDTIQTREKRNATDAEVQRLPDAPAQRLADADPATAAGKLRTGGWLRAPGDRQD